MCDGEILSFLSDASEFLMVNLKFLMFTYKYIS